MTYEESIAYIVNSYETKAGKKHPLEVFKEMMGLHNNPEDRLNVIHIAGTNGKGSACAMLTSVLMEAGYTVGTFTSPHLYRFNERIRVNGECISDGEFARQAEAARNMHAHYKGEKAESLSFFEILTAMAYNYFCEQQVDIAIIEVGLGGRLCPTNIVCAPLLSVIASVGYDHMGSLGYDIASIAAEKAGIIKKNSNAVLYSNNEKVYNVVRDIAKKQGSRLHYGGGYEVSEILRTPDETTFCVKHTYGEYDNIRLRLIGDYQIYNACNLLTVLHVLSGLGVALKKEHVYSGLYNARWPGRMELVSKNPFIVLDGAHNEDGAYAVRESADNYFPGFNKLVVIGMLRDKEYEKILCIITRDAGHVFLTKPDNKRALESDELYKLLKPGVSASCFNNYRQAVDSAVKMAGPRDVILITGSLYLVADARKYLTYGTEKQVP